MLRAMYPTIAVKAHWENLSPSGQEDGTQIWGIGDIIPVGQVNHLSKESPLNRVKPPQKKGDPI